MRFLVLAIASFGFVGYIPFASGTFGSLAAVPLFWAFGRLEQWSTVAYLVVFVAAVVVACWAADRAEKVLQEHDSHKIVIDEVVGYLAAVLFLAPALKTALIAFVVFRVFDVLKPFPAGYIDARAPGGIGVTLDDVVSGIYANLATRLILIWL